MELIFALPWMELRISFRMNVLLLFLPTPSPIPGAHRPDWKFFRQISPFRFPFYAWFAFAPGTFRKPRQIRFASLVVFPHRIHEQICQSCNKTFWPHSFASSLLLRKCGRYMETLSTFSPPPPHKYCYGKVTLGASSNEKQICLYCLLLSVQFRVTRKMRLRK